MTSIRAGRIEEAVPSSGEWLFVDLGFSSKSRTCGGLGEQGFSQEMTFTQAMSAISDLAKLHGRPLNLVLEAPLSVSFAENGNPAGRSIELRNGKSRYWYVGPGCSVLVAATYLLRSVAETRRGREIRLFEGLVSFKPRGVTSSHSADVLLLRDVVRGVPGIGRVVPPRELPAQPNHTVRSAFAVSGMDYGVPPIISVGG